MSYVGNTVLPGCEAACAKVVELCRADEDFDVNAIAAAGLAAMQELLELVAACGIIESELNYDQLRMLLKLPTIERHAGEARLRDQPDYLSPRNIATIERG